MNAQVTSCLCCSMYKESHCPKGSENNQLSEAGTVAILFNCKGIELFCSITKAYKCCHTWDTDSVRVLEGKKGFNVVWAVMSHWWQKFFSCENDCVTDNHSTCHFAPHSIHSLASEKDSMAFSNASAFLMSSWDHTSHPLLQNCTRC